MNSLKRTRLGELKIKASILLKDLKGEDPQKQERAASRLLALPFLKGKTTNDLLQDAAFFQLKHALAAIALGQGCNSWNALRTKVIKEDCLFHYGSSAFLNVWFNNYDEAKAYREAHGGYLLQYRKDYVVATREYMDSIGLGNMKREWEAIGYDWVRPASQTAWDALFAVAKANYLGKKDAYARPDKSKRPDWLTNHT